MNAHVGLGAHFDESDGVTQKEEMHIQCEGHDLGRGGDDYRGGDSGHVFQRKQYTSSIHRRESHHRRRKWNQHFNNPHLPRYVDT